MRVVLLVVLLLATLPLGTLLAQESPIAASTWLRRPQRVTSTPHLRVVTPMSLAEAEAEALAAQAEALFAAMAQRAGYRSDEPLWLVFNNDADRHNGFSAQVPHPLVQVDLKPPGPTSTIFDGVDHVRRTLVHEFAHHISNDVDRPTAAVFGRVEPRDPLSFGMFLLTAPSHLTMPRFWHEGFAQWAETAYAPPDTVFTGRGADSLTHAVWRLDAAAGRIPPVGHWRLGYHDWPFGNRVYLYGVAYLRHLIKAHDVDPWELLAAQQKRAPYLFNGGSHPVLGKHHTVLIEEARLALLEEQRQILRRLAATPVTELPRHTGERFQAGPPAWRGDELASASLWDQYGKRILADIDGAGGIDRRRTATGAHLRASADGSLVLARPDGRLHDHPLVITTRGERLLAELRLSMVDIERREDGGWLLAGIRLLPAGGQQLELHELAADLVPTGDHEVLDLAPGRPWSPDLVRTADGLQLCWVATTPAGSRLLAWSVGGGVVRELWSVPARLTHPSWSPDGRFCYVCSDVSGVFNAWRIDTAGGPPQPLTNVVGAVTACVPSPSGRLLALQVLDRAGWYVSLVPVADLPALDELPKVALDWPEGPAVQARGPLALPEVAADELASRPYSSWRELGFAYWTPSLTLSNDGASGLGVAALFADRLRLNQTRLAAGVGAWEQSFVGELHWSYTGLPLDLEAGARRTEQLYADRQQLVTGREYDYTETVGGVFAGIGRRFDVPSDRPVPELRLRIGWDHWSRVEDELPEDLRPWRITPPPFTGEEYYAEVLGSLTDVIAFPDGFGISRGWTLGGSWRRSFGDLERNRAALSAQAWVPVWPAGDHVLELGGDVGWSDGDDTLQSSFTVGSTNFRTTGPHRLGWRAGYRAPLWRPFHGLSTSPWEHRMLVLTGFGTGTLISNDHPGGDGDWYHTVGAKLSTAWRFDNIRLAPGLVVEQELDHEEDTLVYFTLDGG